MRVLIGCEKSGKTREAFRKLDHDAWSCDLEPADDYSPFHYQGDMLNYLSLGWDLLIAHPPCTHLALSGARWCTDHWVENKKRGRWWWDGSEKRRLRGEAVKFFRILLNYEAIPRRCLENPMSMASTLVAPKTQIIHPWQFGHGEKKEGNDILDSSRFAPYN